MKNHDKLDFRLQATESEVIITIMVNNIPLYDEIICKHAEYSFENEEEKNSFIAKSYLFETYPQEKLSEEILFYYNFPENLMPVDYKHLMIGFSPVETLGILYQPILETNDLNLSTAEINEMKNYLKEMEFENGVVCLVHTCQSISCSHILMQLVANIENNTIVMHSFRDSFNTKFHQDLKFIFDKEQYLEVLHRLKIICDDTKNYEDYQKFQTGRFYRENDDLFKEL